MRTAKGRFTLSAWSTLLLICLATAPLDAEARSLCPLDSVVSELDSTSFLDPLFLAAQADSMWLAWCAEAHCMSTDSAIWYAGTSSHALSRDLDTAAVVQALIDLNKRTPLDLSPHGAVLDRVVFMMRNRPRFLGKMMGRSAHYFPLFEEALDRHNLPLELKYLPVLESGLNPLARSGAGATGLWQFMYATDSSQNLAINSWVDERRDPHASTEAACRFLKRLHKMYDGDWHLALAAYNAGSGNVNKAIRRSGSRDFWKVRRFLPRETAKYVPSLIALVYLFEHPMDAGLVPSDPLAPRFALDTLMLRRNVRFDQVARAMGRPESEVAQLNPQYRKALIPGEIDGGWPLVLYVDDIGPFLDALPEALEWEADKTPKVNFEPEVSVYRVRSGDVLGSIARKHGVSVRELRSWNGLRGDMIRVGQKLYIHADPR